MAEKDAVTKIYMRDNRVFADVCNFFLKKKLIHPDNLSECDTTTLFIPKLLGDVQDKAIQQYRDILKECAIAMEDNHVSYVLFGVENQSKIDYSMVLRTFIYDAMCYNQQLHEIAAKHREMKDYKGRKDTDLTTRFYKEDRIKPVVTLVVYYGLESWDASLDLYSLFQDGCEELYPLIDNYNLKVMDAANLTDEELEQLESSLHEVMVYIKYAKDKEKLARVIRNNEKFKYLDKTAAQVIESISGRKFKIEEKEEGFDMCKALQDIEDDARQEGRREGKIEGKIEGILEERV